MLGKGTVSQVQVHTLESSQVQDHTLEPLHGHDKVPYDLETRLLPCWLLRLGHRRPCLLLALQIRCHQRLLARPCLQVYIMFWLSLELALHSGLSFSATQHDYPECAFASDCLNRLT